MPTNISSGVGASLGGDIVKAQFDINAKLFIQPQGSQWVLANSANDTRVFKFPIFGLSDFIGGYKNFRNRVKNANFKVYNSIVQGADTYYITSKSSTGDLILEYRPTPNDGNGYIVLISCKQVAYGTLLSSIESDTFHINKLRLSCSKGQIGFAENFEIVRQTLFGKMSNDSLSPMAFMSPSQNQNNVVDVPLGITIDKELMFIGGISPSMGGELNFSFQCDLITKRK